MKNFFTLLHGVMKTPSKKQEKLIDGNPLRRVREEEKEKKAVEKLEDDQLITEHFMAGLCLMGQLVQIKPHYLIERESHCLESRHSTPQLLLFLATFGSFFGINQVITQGSIH
nr:PREDICTED: uncharacterized protein LOC108953391 [Musa acuminata subsp. malaccensis]